LNKKKFSGIREKGEREELKKIAQGREESIKGQVTDRTTLRGFWKNGGEKRKGAGNWR